MPIWLFNILITPILLVRVVILVILICIARLGEFADRGADFVNEFLPVWRESAAFRKRRVDREYAKALAQIPDRFKKFNDPEHSVDGESL